MQKKTINVVFTNTLTGSESFSYDLGENKITQIHALVSEGPFTSIAIGTSDVDVAGTVYPFFKGNANSLLIDSGALDRSTKIIVNQRYLRVTIDQNNGDITGLVITYYQFDSTDQMASVLKNVKGTLDASASTEILPGVVGKQITVRNIVLVAGASLTTSAVYYTQGSAVKYYEHAFQNVSTSISNSIYPILLGSPLENISLGTTETINYYISYVEEPA